MKEQILERLSSVIDPELGVSVVDLGLIYGVEVGDEGDVKIKMTMTTPHCPLVSIIQNQVQKQVSSVEGVKSVLVELVWEPVWTPEKMSPEAKLQLGFGGLVD